MTFDIQSYSRADLFSVGQTTSISSVILPLPNKLVDTQQVHYEQKPVGATIGNAFQIAAPSLTNAAQSALNGQGKQAIDDLAPVFTANNGQQALAAGGVNAVDALDSKIGGSKAAIQAATGYSPNYFLTVLLDGPAYKTHNFMWQVSARNPAESETINRIIRVFNNAQAPALAFNGAVFSFPRVFRIAYRPNPRYLYKLKPAVLVNFTVDYSGGGVPSFYRAAGVTNNQNAPVMLVIQATFLELEFWLRSDYGGDDDGAGGTLPDDTRTTTGSGRNV
jgi:hypothetical protein